jgi:phenylacetate-CoA ligase
MTAHYDDLETRGADERAASLAEGLPLQIRAARGLPGYREALDGYDPDEITTREALARLPVLRKSALTQAQTPGNPLGGYAGPVSGFAHVFQSPGPIYEPGQVSRDWWRLGRFLHAAGVGPGDIMQNCFSYHLVPAGMMFESAARAVGATVLPAGTGQTDLQARAARDVGATGYAGTPDFLKVILDRAEEMGLSLAITKAVVSGGALFPSLRKEYADRGSRRFSAMPPPIWA